MLGVVPSERERRTRAGDLLDAVGIGQRLHRLPAQLGYGERRRLALAVALGNHPRLLLADEVTAGLDDEAGDRLLGDLSSLLPRLGGGAIIVAHGRAPPRHLGPTLPLPHPPPVPGQATPRARQGNRP